MNKGLKVILISALALIAMLLVTSCSDGSPYESYDDEGFEVSVKFDANGGTLTDGVSVIVDTYNVGSLPEQGGMKVAQLIAPENTEIRGAVNKFNPRKNGYSCVGWYAKRVEVTDKAGNVSYVYADKWDFENDRLRIDPKKEYTSGEPVLTLYAAWVPNFSFEFYSIDDPDTVLGTVDNVKVGGEIVAPIWDSSDNSLFLGDLEDLMNKYMPGKTFIGVYTDPEGKNRLSGETIKHFGTLDYTTATAVNPVMKLYIEAWEGDWQYVYDANKFIKNFDMNGNYVIMNDIDFRYYDELMEEYAYHKWPSLNINNEFTGKIVGISKENGERVKIKNVNFTQASSTSIFAMGMFGKLGDGAVIENVDFENITMTIDKGSPRVAIINYGLLAGRIDAGARVEDVSISGMIRISSKCVFLDLNQVSIGLVCGAGSSHGVNYAGVMCEIYGSQSKFDMEIDGDKVILSQKK